MQIRADKREYSRYDSSCSIITARLSGLSIGQVYTVSLVRSDGYGMVWTGDHTATATTAQVPIALDPIRDPVTRLNMARSGKYTLTVALGVSVAGSPPFTVVLVTTAQVRQSELFGVPLSAMDVFAPVKQPAAISGVRIGYIDNGTYKGAATLSYTAASRSLAWQANESLGAGPAAAVIGDDMQTLALLTAEGESYVEVTVDPFLLPTVNVSESIIVDTVRVTDIEIAAAIKHATDTIGATLHLSLEPTIVATNPSATIDHHDQRGTPADYTPSSGLFSIQLPSSAAMPLQYVYSLSGHYANPDQTVYSIPREWVVINRKAGIVDVVPTATSQGILASTFWGAAGLVPIRGGRVIPGFWHYRVVGGLADLNGERAPIRDAIAKEAALRILHDLSLAISAGRTSLSASRDGVSESWNYGAGGAYGEKIGIYTDWLKENLPRLRQRHRGFVMATLE